jgi:carboxyl-terminal processing protease
MFVRILLGLFLISAPFCDAKPPQLTPHDARIKVEEILKAHVSYQRLTPDLIKRTLVNYLEEVDPGKTYFIDYEIVKWTNPSEELVQKTLDGYKKEDFSTFEEIHESLIFAINRRNLLEQHVALESIPKDVQPSEFKDLTWAIDERELSNRLLRIKALQIEAAEKLEEETKDQLLLRLTKRRLNREEELISPSSKLRQQLILSYVLKATSSALDSQTAYFTPAEASQFMIQVQQRLFGIGAQLRDDLNGFTIVRLLDESPASKENKLQIGDRIIAVNNEPVVGMDITEAVELIRGQQATSVLLTILRQIGEENKKDEKLEIEIVRGEIVLKETRLDTSFEVYGDGAIGILHLFSFYQDSKSSSANDLAKAIESLKKEHNLKGIILDLRNNAGGILPQAVAVTGLFINKGVVVSIKDNTGKIQHLRNIEGKPVWEGPLIVLTNRTSASAAEIVAQTLQDYGRAIIIGDPQTYGKGTFQTFTLEAVNYGKVNPKGEYKVTRGCYYTVSGKSPQLNGVQTDIVVPGIFAQAEIGEKYSKFPLENDQIPPSFEDDLSDIPAFHRHQLLQLYKFNLQTIMTSYQPYVALLSKNSNERIQKNKNYQNFLKEISKTDHSADTREVFGQSDLQLDETINIMKDLIYLLQEEDFKSKKLACNKRFQSLALSTLFAFSP